ncbi:MAG: hypothetical protein AABO57_12415 [Acidobacteriota bacterium]
MKQADDNDELLVQYLLGELGEEGQEAVEKRYISDPEFYEQLLVVEDDLIDAYTRGELRQSRRKNFENHFLCSPDRRARVGFADAWTAYLGRQSEAGAVAQRPSRPRSLLESLRIGHWPATLRVAAAILVLLVGASLIAETIRLRNRVNQAESQRATLEEEQRALEQQMEAERRHSQELSSQLERERNARDQQTTNQTNPDQTASGIISLVLTPGLVRGTAAAKRLVIPLDARLVTLQINVRGNDYKSYRAVIRTVEGREVWSKSDLKAQPKGNGRVVVLRLPPSALATEDYILTLSGVDVAGAAEVIDEYSFSASKK